MKGLAGVFDQMSMRFGELSKVFRGKGTIIVHPQLSDTFEEAAELDKDWRKREIRQIQENISKSMGRR